MSFVPSVESFNCTCASFLRGELRTKPRVPVGFDTEFDSSIPFTEPKLILVQICVNQRVWLFDKEDWGAHKSSVRDVLNDERVVVCGRGVLQDLLISDLCVPKAKCLDSELGQPRIGLYDQVNRALPREQRFEKDKETQTSFKHEKKLTERQLKYAATDAYVSWLLWRYKTELNLWQPFTCPDETIHKRLKTVMREMHGRQEKQNLRFKLASDGSVVRESRKLFVGQSFRTDDDRRYVVSHKNYVDNHRLKDCVFHDKCITVEDDSDRLFRDFLLFCAHTLYKKNPVFSPNGILVKKIVRGPPGTGKTHQLVQDAARLAKQKKSVLILCPKNVNCLDVHKRLVKLEAKCSLVVMNSYREHWHEAEYKDVPHVKNVPLMKKGKIVVVVADVYLSLQTGTGNPDHILWDEASLQAGVLFDIFRPQARNAWHWLYGDDYQMKPFGKNLKSAFDVAANVAPAAVETLTTTYRVGENDVWKNIFRTVYDVNPTFYGETDLQTEVTYVCSKDALTKNVVSDAKKRVDATILCVSRAYRDQLHRLLPRHTVMTIFKSQGSEWKNVIVAIEITQILADVPTRVVALTRATERCDAYVLRGKQAKQQELIF